MISVDRALEIVLAASPRLPHEELALADAAGRILAEDVVSDTDLPPFDRAAMDGYAVRSADASAGATLTVVAEVRAGQYPDRAVEPGEAIAIMTGAPVPRGADAVQPIEKTRSDDGRRVQMLRPVDPGQNIARRGSEVSQGADVLRCGESLDAAAISVLATVGKGRVRVGRRPEVALLATGDELVDVFTVPSRGRIRNSSTPALLAQIRAAGAVPFDLGVVADEREAIAQALLPAFRHDVVVVSGGVSAGAYDLVEEAFARYDVKVAFDKVAIKPGAPLVFGRRGEKLVFGLPGNPVSAQVTFEIFVRAALLRMQGARACSRPTVVAELAGTLRNRSGRKAYLPVRVRFDSGRFVAEPVRTAGSADVVAHARANALGILEADRLEASAGEQIAILLVSNFLDRDG